MGRLDGKVVLITGGARGQGAAECRLFASEGARVVITDVRDAEGNATARAAGATYLHHDVSSEEAWQQVVDRAVALHGRIDGLVNNAGIFDRAPLLGTTMELYQRTIAINQTGVFLGLRTVAPVMVDGGGGSIVNISSTAGLGGSRIAFAYSASKWAVRGMTKSAALELAKHRIRVNSIHPGPINTEMIRDISRDPDNNPAVPLGRDGTPEEVARLALFLISDESSYSTGSEFVIDGGMKA
jgi:3alpha(or 20beta)-hydroxysteroid dehydrogenase